MATNDSVVIVDYGMGNLGSIANMIKKVGGKALISSDPRVVAQGGKMILPGVGSFDSGMRQLKDRGLIETLNRKALDQKIPVLGICLGMQLLTRRSEEGSLPGLGWIDAETRRFAFSPATGSLRIPHMGWNAVTPLRNGSLFPERNDAWRFYFVHSYHVCCVNDSEVLCTTTYGQSFTSGVSKGNIYGVQFHPEKSHSFGMRLLRSFLEL